MIAWYATYKIVTNGIEFGGEMSEESLTKALVSPQFSSEEEPFQKK